MVVNYYCSKSSHQYTTIHVHTSTTVYNLSIMYGDAYVHHKVHINITPVYRLVKEAFDQGNVHHAHYIYLFDI